MRPRRTALRCSLAVLLAGCGVPAASKSGGRDAASSDSTSQAPPDSAVSTTDGTSDAPGIDAGEAAVDGGAADAGVTGDGAGDEAIADSMSEPVDVPMPVDGSACNAVIEQHPVEGFNHVAVCAPVTYLTKPPSSGDHYPIWAAYMSYSIAIPEGFWVHNLEHGAVVISYNCPSGCASEVAAAQAWIDGLSDDPICDPTAGDPRIRVVMTPDPKLDVRFAASAWGFTLRADCFEASSFTAFFQAHYGQGREALCSQGEDLSLGFQEGCGE